MTKERLEKLKRMYERPEGIGVPVEVRVISDLLIEIERLNAKLREAK